MSGLIYKAQHFAERVHAEQKRKFTGEPYVVHLREVANLCAEVGARQEVVAAAWLHDCIEDQGVLMAELMTLFGGAVAELMWAVTDQSRPRDGNRAARKLIDRLHVAGGPPDAKTIKLADLISNGKDILAHDKSFAVTFFREMALLMPRLSDGNSVLFNRARNVLRNGERALGL